MMPTTMHHARKRHANLSLEVCMCFEIKKHPQVKLLRPSNPHPKLKVSSSFDHPPCTSHKHQRAIHFSAFSRPNAPVFLPNTSMSLIHPAPFIIIRRALFSSSCPHPKAEKHNEKKSVRCERQSGKTRWYGTKNCARTPLPRELALVFYVRCKQPYGCLL